MKEIKAILSTYRQKTKSEKVALATVVRVEGSSYRRMGARMLVSENGNWIGGISGGCLEGDALKRARMAILKERASVITYDTSIDDDHQIGVGLGCNGIIDVLFSPINENDPSNAIEVLKKATSSTRNVRKLITIASCEDKQLTGKLFEFHDVESLNVLADIVNSAELAHSICSIEKSKYIIVHSSLSLFVEILPPPLQLLLFGHQYDVYPLIRQIKELGWDYSVVAPKTKVKDENVIEPSRFNNDIIDDFTAAILMSHSLQTDKENLKILLESAISYIGMLGPRVRSERIFKELNISHKISSIYAPTGLDIGATNPEEIALSILAEIKSVFSERTAAHLRERDIPIHSREQAMNFN
jgi:xanthine/CO dehydrogenase XdhC/CoxF family maturation factor